MIITVYAGPKTVMIIRMKNPTMVSLSISRALAVLDLFDADHPTWTVERICAVMDLSQPTGSRYVRELLAARLLLRVADATYGLGPRLINLDFVMRQTDLVLAVTAPVMRQFVRRVGCDCVLSVLFGRQIIDTHRESGCEPVPFAYSRGRPRPLFRGAAARIILSAQPAAWLREVYDDYAEDIARAGLGDSWTRFQAELSTTRRRNYYVSRDELEPGLAAIAVPILSGTPEATRALTLVTEAERFEILNHDTLIRTLSTAAEHIASAIK